MTIDEINNEVLENIKDFVTNEVKDVVWLLNGLKIQHYQQLKK